MMKLSELRAGQGSVNVEVKVKSKQEPRTMQKYGRELKVANAVVEDSSGEIKMSLWNADVEKVNVGDVIKITNGYVSEFNGEKQLTSGKFGKLEVVKGNGDAVAAESSVAKGKYSTSEHDAAPKKAKDDSEMAEEDSGDSDDSDDFEEKEF